MKNMTISLEDDLYRRARVAAAEADTSVTALVREFLTHFTATGESALPRSLDRAADILEIIDTMRKRHPGFEPGDRLSREELHAR